MEMTFERTIEYAKTLDSNDPIAELRQQFLFPKQNDKPFIYLCAIP